MSLITKDQLSSSIDLIKNLISFKADKNDLNDLSDRVEEVQDSSFNKIIFSKEIKTIIPPSSDIFNIGSTLEFKNEYTNEELVQIINQHSSNTDPLMLMANDSMSFGIIDSTLVLGPWASPGIYDLLIMIGDTVYSYSVPDQCWYCANTYPEKLSVMSITIENNNFQFPCGEDVVLSLLAGKEVTENQTITIEAANTDKAIPLKAGEGIEFTSENNELVVSSNISAFNKASIFTEKTLEEYLQPGNLISFKESYDQNTLKAINDYMPGYDVIQLTEDTTDENRLILTTYVTNHNGLYSLCVRATRGYSATTTTCCYYGYVDYSGNQHLNWCLIERGYVIEENLPPPSFVATDNFSYYQYEDKGFAESLFQVGGYYSLSASDVNKDLVLIPGEGINLSLQDNGILIEGSAKIEIDDWLSDTSANPVQNQAITNAINNIYNSIDSVSSNLNNNLSSHNTDANAHKDIRDLIDEKIEAALSTLAKVEEVAW